MFNEASTQVTACPPSQIVSSSNSTATRPSRPTERPWLGLIKWSPLIVTRIRAVGDLGRSSGQCTATAPATGMPEAPSLRALIRRRASSSRLALI
jgi:hypothetical protein